MLELMTDYRTHPTTLHAALALNVRRRRCVGLRVSLLIGEVEKMLQAALGARKHARIMATKTGASSWKSKRRVWNEASDRLKAEHSGLDTSISTRSVGATPMSELSLTRQTFKASAHLGAFWPIFILGDRGEEACTPINMLDALYPDSVDEARALYLPIFERVCPAAAVGLILTEDDALTYWVNVLRGPLLTGEHDELTFLPSWCKADGVTLTGLTRLLSLQPDQRMDVFMAAMEMTGMGL